VPTPQTAEEIESEQSGHMKQMAHISAAAYRMEKVISIAEAPEGFDIDREFSSGERTVFTKGGRAVLAFRGTNPLNVTDLGTDVMIALGMERYTRRFAASLDVTERLISKYGIENVEVTGHSLGGTQALYVNSKTGVKATAFNPGAWLPQAEQGMINHIKGITQPDATIYSTTLDPISLLSVFQGARYIHVKANTVQVHALSNFY
jgi:hypothetical protein